MLQFITRNRNIRPRGQWMYLCENAINYTLVYIMAEVYFRNCVKTFHQIYVIISRQNIILNFDLILSLSFVSR